MPWYLNPVFLPAASGLLGVIVGGLITAGSSYLLDKRRERREREREEREAATELKRAARMLSANLLVFCGDMRSVLREKRWSVWKSSDYSPGAWVQYQTVLAPKLTNSAWKALIEAFLSINAFIAPRQQADEVERVQQRASDSLSAAIERVPDTHAAEKKALEQEWLNTLRDRHRLLDSTAAAIEVLLQNIETAHNEIAAFSEHELKLHAA